MPINHSHIKFFKKTFKPFGYICVFKMKPKMNIDSIPMHTEYSDAQLLEIFHAGKTRDKERVFGIIVKRYSRSLYSYLRHILVSHDDTDDVLQETFIKAWGNLGTVKDGAALKNWLYRIASNIAINHLRQKASAASVSIDDYDVADELDTREDMEKMDLMSRLTSEAIRHLPKKQQMVFTMKHFEGLKYSQISEILDTSEGALKASYHIAVEKIKSYVEEKIKE